MDRQIKLSATNVAQILDQNCMRKMVFDTTTQEKLISQDIKKNSEIDPKYPQLLVTRLLLREGNIFEQDIYDGLDQNQSEFFNDVKLICVRPKEGHSKYGRVKSDVLIPFFKNTPELNHLFFQVEIPVTESFVKKYIPKIESSILKKDVIIIDLLFYDALQHSWFVIDVKKSEVVSNSHRYQIAFYWMVLNTWIQKDLGISVTISLTGYIRLKGSISENFLGEAFDITPFVGRVADALAYSFPLSLKLSLDHPNWHLIYSCVKCSFFLHCQQDSKNNHFLSELPYLTKTGKQYLNDSKIILLEEAQEIFRSDPNFGSDSSSIKRERKQIKKRIDTKIKFLNEPESYPWEFIRKPIYDMPNPFFLEFPIFISSEKEYIYGYVYQISILYRDRGDKKLSVTKSLQLSTIESNLSQLKPVIDTESSNNHFISFIMEEPTDHEQIRILKECLKFVNTLLSNISDLSEDLPNYKRTTHFFFLDKIDMKNIYSTSLKYSLEDEELQYEVEKLLSFFPPTQEYIDDEGDPDVIWNIPFTFLSQVVRKCLILPVESTAWKIQDIWRDKETKEPLLKVRRPSKRYLQAISNQFTLLFADDYWKKSKYLSKKTEDGKKNLVTLIKYKTKLSMLLYWNLARLNGKNEKSIFTLFKTALAKTREIVGKSTELDQLAEDLLVNMPDDQFVRPLNYFQSCENLTESISYYRNICSDLQERLSLGVTLGDLRIKRAYLPNSRRERGFYAIFQINGLNTSKFQLERGDYILTDVKMADNLYSMKFKERKMLYVSIRQVETTANLITITLKIPGNRRGIIKHPFFKDIELSREGEILQKHHFKAIYYLDLTKMTIISSIIRNFLTSFAYLRLSDQFPDYLAKFIPPTTLSNFKYQNPKVHHSSILQDWEKIQVLKELSNFNTNQREAVNSILLENSISLVWGPPGTGKTRIIAWSIILSLFKINSTGYDINSVMYQKIAVTAFTNRAIDNAMEKFLQALVEYSRQPLARDIGEIFIIRARGKRIFTIYTYNSDSLTHTETDNFDYYEDLVKDEYSTVIVFGTVFQLNHLSEDELILNEAFSRVNNSYAKANFKTTTQVFDLIVVDEASQLKVTEFFMSSFTIKFNGKFLIVGDDKQLSPVITGEYPEEFSSKVGSIYSYFKELISEIKPIMLTQTYRFSSFISNFPSKAYYNGELYSNKISQDIELSTEANSSYLKSILDDSKEIILFTYDGVVRAPDNEIEAEIVAKIISFYDSYLLHMDRLLRNDEFKKFIGVITPHNAQINAINNAVLKEGISQNRIPLIDTVDKYQGQERNIIIISYGVSDADYAEREIDFILSPNRFNVSITRPEKKYIVILSESLINIVPEEEDLIKYAFLFQDFKNSFENRQEFTFELSNRKFSGNLFY